MPSDAARMTSYVVTSFATRHVAAGSRGRVTGYLVRAILIGILLARTLSGEIGFYVGWRAVYGLAAGLMVGILVLLRRVMPHTPDLAVERYPRLVRSLWTLFLEEPRLRRAMVTQGLNFGGLNILWVGLNFYLQGPMFRLTVGDIGWLGLLGAVSACAAPVVGRIADRHGTRNALLLALGVVVIAWVAMLSLPGRWIGILVGIVLIDLGMTGVDISSRTLLYNLAAEIRTRLSAVYTIGMYGGGSFAIVRDAAALGARELAWRLPAGPGMLAERASAEPSYAAPNDADP